MRLNRGLSQFLPKATVLQESGHAHDVVSHSPILSSRRGSVVDAGYISSDEAPLFLKLRCRLHPILNSRVVYGTCTRNGKLYEPVPLWEKDRQPLSKINILFEKEGAYFDTGKWRTFYGEKFKDYNLTFNDNFIGKKEFITSEAPICIQSDVIWGETEFKPSSNPSAMPFFGYGGSYYHGSSLFDIMQYYYTLSHNGDKTVVQRYSTKNLRERGCAVESCQVSVTKSLGKIIIMEKVEVHHGASLGDDVSNGRMSFELCHKGERLMYVSTKAEQLGKSDFLDMAFRRVH